MPALAEPEPPHRGRRRHDRPRPLGERAQRHVLDVLDGQHLPPPAHRRGQRQDDADRAHRDVGDEAGDGQRDAEPQHHGPRGGRGHLERVRLRRRCHRPITYTTVNTTIHTASTKCQYQDTISTRSACAGLSAPDQANAAAEAEHDEPDDDVGGVQAHERIEGRPEEIGADRQVLPIDQAVPLPRRAGEEDRAQRHGHGQPAPAAPHVPPRERARAERDEDAARQETDGAEHGQLEHLARIRSVEALADVEEVRDHEHREQRALGDDEADHAHAPAPRVTHLGRLGHGGGTSSAHSCGPSRSSGCFRSQSGRRLVVTGTTSKL